MRLVVSAISLLAACVVVVACNGKDIAGECPTGGRTGDAPNCILHAQCVGTNVGVEIDCSAGNGQCVCSENGVIGKTVDYKDDFCTGGTADDVSTLNASLDSANDACGWNL